MGIVLRVLLAVFILIVDFFSFFVPLGSLAIAWVIVARPRWARDLVARLYGEDEPTDEGPVAVTLAVEDPPGDADADEAAPPRA